MTLTDVIAGLLFASTSSFLLLYVLSFKPSEYHYTFFPVPLRSVAAWVFPLLHFAGAAYLLTQTFPSPVPASFKAPHGLLSSVLVMYILALMVEFASHRAELSNQLD